VAVLGGGPSTKEEKQEVHLQELHALREDKSIQLQSLCAMPETFLAEA